MREHIKKLYAAFLLVLCLLTLTGCGGKCAAVPGSLSSPEQTESAEATEQPELAESLPVQEPLTVSFEPVEAGTPLRIMVATDLHYISPRINDNGPRFMRAVESGDGKLSEYCEQIVDELIRTAIREKPDALVLTGDLTFNGEKDSLEDLAEKLWAVQEAGVPVLVLPGNHDVGYPFAFAYAGEDAYWAANISQPDFTEICGPFGYDGALSRDAASFSYMYGLAEDCRLLFLDANTADGRGGLKEETLQWAQAQLQAANEAGTAVISVSHQNVLAQSEMLSSGYVIKNCRKTAALLREYGVSTHLSGHSHIQHSAAKDGLTDYCTGCLSLFPLRYAVLELDEARNVSYGTGHLAILQEEAAERMISSNRAKIVERMAGLDIPEEEAEQMADFAARLNLDYFAGQVDAEAARADPAWALWEKYGTGNFWLPYMQSMLGSG